MSGVVPSVGCFHLSTVGMKILTRSQCTWHDTRAEKYSYIVETTRDIRVTRVETSHLESRIRDEFPLSPDPSVEKREKRRQRTPLSLSPSVPTELEDCNCLLSD